MNHTRHLNSWNFNNCINEIDIIYRSILNKTWTLYKSINKHFPCFFRHTDVLFGAWHMLCFIDTLLFTIGSLSSFLLFWCTANPPALGAFFFYFITIPCFFGRRPKKQRDGLGIDRYNFVMCNFVISNVWNEKLTC